MQCAVKSRPAGRGVSCFAALVGSPHLVKNQQVGGCSDRAVQSPPSARDASLPRGVGYHELKITFPSKGVQRPNPEHSMSLRPRRASCGIDTIGYISSRNRHGHLIRRFESSLEVLSCTTQNTTLLWFMPEMYHRVRMYVAALLLVRGRE